MRDRGTNTVISVPASESLKEGSCVLLCSTVLIPEIGCSTGYRHYGGFGQSWALVLYQGQMFSFFEV